MSAEFGEPSNSPPGRRRVSAWVLIGAAAVVVVVFVAGNFRDRAADVPTPQADSQVAQTPEKRHAVVIRKPDAPPGVKTGLTDHAGRPVEVACATCHATMPPNPDARLGTDLKLFHQGLHGSHGNLACSACHNPDDGYASLRLADGKPLPYPEVMQLCAQCHGPQYRDYLNGAHGGMTGYWDLTRGGRVRNNCVDCHDPHAPRYPTVRPVPGPRDRDPTGSLKEGAGHE
jgi:hypothetical protein